MTFEEAWIYRDEILAHITNNRIDYPDWFTGIGIGLPCEVNGPYYVRLNVKSAEDIEYVKLLLETIGFSDVTYCVTGDVFAL